MNTDRWTRVKDIFMAAIQQPSDEREAFLEEACQEDQALRREVETLLAGHEDSKDFMELSTEVGLISLAARDKCTSRRIGPYLLQRIISTGGMGTVYEALQENPQRTVALKVMKEGTASKSILRRFEYESQILARLRHPNIAQVIEAGTHIEEGQGKTLAVPYFVMEYIPDARPITEYASEKNQSMSERLELFLSVCDAVHHGHQKGIIHRDLKPSNLLVDASGKMKIIDFGVARSLDSDVRLTTVQTDVGQLIGTVQYMSPEQCRADPYDLDIRSDVYALGVVLYELLCEQLPYNVKKAAVFEATRIIQEAPPKKPSTVNRKLKGDIETIVLKALEKEKTHRYQTVADLGDDVRRYLKGEVILAKPVGPATKVWKKVKRNPLLSGAVFVAILAVMVLLVYIPFISHPQLRQEKKKAEEEAEITKTINQFLQETLATADPFQEGKEVKVLEILDRAAERIDREFPDRPEIEASLRQTLGVTYFNNGRYDKAEEQLGKALEIRRRMQGEEDADTLYTMNRLGAVFRDQGRFQEAESVLRRSLDLCLNLHGAEDSLTLQAKNSLAIVLQDQGRFEEAAAMHREVLEIKTRLLGNEDDSTLSTMGNLALVLMEQDKYDEAEIILREVVKDATSLMGPNHPFTLNSMNNLALVLEQRGKLDEAETLIRKALETQSRVLSEEHPNTLNTMQSLAMIYRKRGDLDLSESSYRKVVKIRSDLQGGRHPDTLMTKHGLALVLQDQDKLDEAETLFREVIAGQSAVLSEEHPDTCRSMYNLALTLRYQAKFGEAETWYRKALKGEIQYRGEGHKYTLQIMNNLAMVLRIQEKFDEAESLLKRGLQIAREVLPEGHHLITYFQMNYGICLVKLDRFDEAEGHLKEGYRALKVLKGENHRWTQDAVHQIIRLYEAWGKPDEAEAWRTIQE
jgi:tetratricopeptide (TPR) repeat protein